MNGEQKNRGVKTALWVVALVFLLFGCRSSQLRLTREDFQNEQKGESQAFLKLPNGTKLPVTVIHSITGDTVQVSINTQGEELEQEQYRLTDSEFDLVRADTDVFSPPIPLLKFPSSPGPSWDWKGTAKEGATDRSATAAVASSQLVLLFGDTRERVDKVIVHLSIDSGTPVPAKRDLSFWFIEGRGLVKREFGAGSTRSPLDEGK